MKIKNNIEDEILMKNLQHSIGKKKNDLFEVLYQRYTKKMLEFFYYSFFKDELKAQDFMQELFLKIYEGPDKFDVAKKFRPWIYSVASNMVKNEFRKSDIQRRFLEHQKHQNSHAINSQPEQELDVATLIDSLNAEQKTMILLRYKFKMSVKEISIVVEKPEGTVRSKLFYAMQDLRQNIKSH